MHQQATCIMTLPWRTYGVSFSNNSHALCVLSPKYYSRVSLLIKMSALYVVCLLLLFLIFFLTLLLILLLLSLFFVIVVIIIITVPFSWFIARAVNLSRKGSLIY